MSFSRKVVVSVAVITVAALSLLLASGVFTVNAAPGPFRMHIDTGVVVIGHAGGCFVQEGNVEAEGTTAPSPFPFFFLGPTTGRFVAHLKLFGTDPAGAERPCGTIRGTVNFEAHPHFAGLFGSWQGTVTSHSGPQPLGNFTNAPVIGNWQIRHVAPGSGLVVGEGSINISIF